MPVFYPEAIHAALNISGRSIDLPGEVAFEKWSSTCDALGQLTYQERCDAIYADYVLQLAAPGGHSQLQIRDLLLGQGALAANYLAELAQNADDAAVDDEAKLCVHFKAPWLIVGNNGQMVDPGNLLGLSRFFVHWGRDDGELAQKLDAAAIGKFGIGFKSCYRVAREMLVYSWEGKDEAFAFRLPIVKTGDDLSTADEAKWNQIAQAVKAIAKNVDVAPEQRGYCTPEYLSPEDYPEVLNEAKALCRWDRGTVFCFNLHEEGQGELQERIQVGADGLYELCPLFLPHIREITLNEHKMIFSKTRALQRDAGGLPIVAQRATLTNSSAGVNSHDRYWLLSGEESESKWMLAVAAGSDHKVRIESHTDGGFHLRSGGAYAYFPLNAVNQTWSSSIRLHLHIDLPTNLARSDWNDSESPEVRRQIEEAARCLVAWLGEQRDFLHADFTALDLFNQIPNTTAKWAHCFYEAFRKATDEAPIFRTLTGKAVNGGAVRVIPLKAFADVKAASKRVAEAITGANLSHAAMFTWDSDDWGLQALNAAQTAQTINELAEGVGNNDSLHRDLSRLIFALANPSGSLLEKCAEPLQVTRKNGQTISLKRLLEGVGGSELLDEWHALFRSVKNTNEPALLALHVCGKHLGQRLGDLSQARQIFEWEAISSDLATEDHWNRHGALFWSSAKPPCPSDLTDQVIQHIRIKDNGGRWERIDRKWLFDNNPCQCFLGLITSWKTEYQFSREVGPYVEKLKLWGLWEAYRSAIDERITGLKTHLQERLGSDFSGVIDELDHQAFSKTLERLVPGNQALVSNQIEDVLTSFLEEKIQARETRRFFVAAGMQRETLVILAFLGFRPAGTWLHEKAQSVYRRFDALPDDVVILRHPLQENEKESLAKELLQRAWRIDDAGDGTQEAVSQIHDWFGRVTGNWEVRVAGNKQVHLRDCSAVEGDEDALAQLLEANGKNVDDLPHRLPAALSRIPRLREIAASANSISISILNGDHAQPITTHQIDPDLGEVDYVRAALKENADLEVRYLSPLNFELKNQGNRLIAVQNARCVVASDRLYVNRAAVADDHAHQRLLAVYLSYHNNRELDALDKQGEPARKLYYQFRRKILGVFRKELVEDVGYKKKDIVRELLQNAESAYASQAETPERKKSFCLSALEVPGSKKVGVTVEHYGRPFNAIDTHGKQRDDISRIVSQGNQPETRVEGEIGRFNRGFKSVFHVTECVEIRSGPYSFQIRDLLLVEPTNPKPEHEDQKKTTFSFEASPGDARALFGVLERAPQIKTSSLVFLEQIEQVELRNASHRRTWSIERDRKGLVGDVRITDEEDRRVWFRVYHFEGGSVAIQMDQRGVPQPIDPKENFLCLTFPGETPGFGHFLLNGLFDTDPGRVSLMLNHTAGRILEAALRQLSNACTEAVDNAQDAEDDDLVVTWKAWAALLTPDTLKAEIGQRLGSHSPGALQELSRTQNFLLENIPHNDFRVNHAELIFPNQTLRKLARGMGESFPATNRKDWCEQSIHETVKKFIDSHLKELTVPDWIEGTSFTDEGEEALVNYLRQMLGTEKNVVLRNEIESALHKLQPTLDEPVIHFRLPLDNLVEWWKDNEDETDYTLDGAWSELLVGEASVGDTLRNPNSPGGRLAWYRFLSIAALLSAGRRVTEIRRFLSENALIRAVWIAETRNAFEDACDVAFAEIVGNPPNTAMAAGEYAYLWRRVFYDLRKMHYLVYECDFATSLLELCQKGHSVTEILRFVRGGQVPGGDIWSGVIGQSAGSTLLFVIRELRRLNIYRPEADHHCYFMCRPVRRAAARFGLLDEEAVNESDLNKLLDQAQCLHEKIQENPAARAALGGFYDIPFLHFAQEEL